MPFACATAVSIGVVIKPAMDSGSAPGYAVDMVTTPFSVFGYASTCRAVKDLKPSTRMARLTTDANTGRRMNRSVNFTGRLRLYSLGGFGLGLLVGTRSLLMATT